MPEPEPGNTGADTSVGYRRDELAGLLYANSTAIAGIDGVWIAVADPDGTLLAHTHLVGHGVIMTDSTRVVGAIHPNSAPQPQTELARRRAVLADEMREALGVGWIIAWAPRHVNFATTALTSHLRDSATSTPTTTEAP